MTTTKIAVEVLKNVLVRSSKNCGKFLAYLPYSILIKNSND